MYCLLMGRQVPWIKRRLTEPPISLENIQQVIQKQKKVIEQIKELRKETSTYSNQFLLLVLEMLHPDIAERPTMQQVVERLEKLKPETSHF